MPHHSVLVRIGDVPTFQRVHRLECPLHRRVHPLQKAILEPHPAHVQRQAKRGNLAKILLIPFP